MHHLCRERHCARLPKAREEQTGVCTGPVSTAIGEVEILRDLEALLAPSRRPDFLAGVSSQALRGNRLHVVTERTQRDDETGRKVLVDLDLHATDGVAGIG